MDRIILAVDGMGGDNAPACVIEGVNEFLKLHEECEVRLFGKTDVITEAAKAFGGLHERVTLIDAPEAIGMEEEPMMAVRKKPNSSLIMGLKDAKEGTSHGFVSAGSTGALMLGGMTVTRLIKGIRRPALAPVMPGLNGPFLLIDSGANADCQSEFLEQFGLMGSVYMNRVMGVENPKVGLVNIGVEEEKGSKLYKEAHVLMKNQHAYNFVGNLEARDVQYGNVDVAVADGFTGNVIIKYAEGFAKCMLKLIKNEIMSTTMGKVGGLLLKPSFAAIKKKMSSDEYGGAPLMGVDGVVVKAHGSSSGYAFMKAMEQALSMIKGGMVDAIKAGLSEITNNLTEEK